MGALGKATNFWSGLTGPARRLIIGSAVIFVVGLFMLMRISGAVDYATLGTADNMADVAAITKELDSKGIPYRLRDGGTTIQVQSGQLYAARMATVTSGGTGGGVGFEIFDKQGWGATDFTQRVNFMRAMQGELSRTIGQLDQVRSANVKLAMPQERLFRENDTPTTASVLLTLSPGSELEPGQVAGITRLVSSAVPGLQAKNVTVTDTQGNILSNNSEDTATSNAGLRMELENAWERDKKAKLDAMLTQVLGPGQAVTLVDATLNLDKVSSQSETYGGTNPDGTAKKVPVLDSDRTKETVNQKGAGSTGVAGASSNTPGANYPATTTGANGTTRYDHTTDRIKNGVDRVVSSRVGVAGDVVKQSVSVQVSDTFTGDMAALTEAVQAAVGFDQKRGDVVVVQKVKFADEAVKVAKAEAQAAAKPAGAPMDIMAIAKTAGAAVGLLLILMMARKSLKRRQTELEKALPELLAAGPVRVAELATTTSGAPIQKRLEGETKSMVERQMEDLAMRKPDDMAKLMRSWLIERR